jgi:hypothetical protein
VALDDYRTRYGIVADETPALGPEPPAGALRQHHERALVAGEVLDASTDPSRSSDGLEQVEAHRREVPGLVPDQEAERTAGWEP